MSASSKEVAPMQVPKASNFWDRLRNVSPLFVILTSFVGGVGVGSSFWSGANSASQADLRRSEADLRRSEADLRRSAEELRASGEELRRSAEELARIKGEFAEYRATHQEKRPSNQERSKGQIKNHSGPDLVSTRSVGGEVEITVKVGETGTVGISGDQVLVSLSSVLFDDKSNSYKLTATIASIGHQVMKIERAEIGDLFTYEGKIKYKIRIRWIKSFAAKFSVAAM